MHRAGAIVFVLSLSAAPLVLLATLACCPQPTCCAGNFCPLSRPHQPQRQSEKENACHPSSAAAGNCAMKSACNYLAHAGAISPLPPVVLPGAVRLGGPELTRRSIRLERFAMPVGTDRAPFQPPRA